MDELAAHPIADHIFDELKTGFSGDTFLSEAFFQNLLPDGLFEDNKPEKPKIEEAQETMRTEFIDIVIDEDDRKIASEKADFENGIPLSEFFSETNKLQRNRQFKCFFCNERIRWLHRARRHYIKQHANERYTCEICNNVIKGLNAFLDHCKYVCKVPSFNDPRKFACYVCHKEKFLDIKDLRRHVIKCANTRVDCFICYRVMGNKLEMNTHIIETHLNLTMNIPEGNCKICKAELSKGETLTHFVSMHMDTNNPFREPVTEVADQIADSSSA